MSGYDLLTAKQHLQAWLAAEIAVTAAQSYTIGTRSLSKANLAEIREQIKFWQNAVARLENMEQGRGRNRAYRFVPRDL
jgi:hypothetical protein